MAPELPWVLEVEPLGMERVLAWMASELLRSPPLLPEEPVLVLPEEVVPPQTGLVGVADHAVASLETPRLVQVVGVGEAASERPEPPEEPRRVQPGEVGGVEALAP